MSLTDCKSDSPQEALERFEAAVDAVSNYQSDILNYGDSDKSFDEIYSEYKSAKAEMLTWLSYIP